MTFQEDKVSERYPAEPRAFTTATAADLLSMSPEVLRYRIRRGQVRAARIGRQFFVPATEIDRLLTVVDVTERAARAGGALA
jgi:excisionase family DNA binding protein